MNRFMSFFFFFVTFNAIHHLVNSITDKRAKQTLTLRYEKIRLQNKTKSALFSRWKNCRHTVSGNGLNESLLKLIV